MLSQKMVAFKICGVYYMALKIQYMSDLHLEFGGYADIPALGDVLVLAGDINLGINTLNFANSMAEDFEHVIFILGNHEYYGQIWPDLVGKIKDLPIKDNVHFLNNDQVVIDGVTFIGGTLWSDISNPLDKLIISAKLNDYQRIKMYNGKTSYSKRPITPSHTTYEFLRAKKFLEDNLVKGSPTVVVTHHLPHFDCIPEQFKSSDLNAAYASDLTNIFVDFEPNVWIHGHTHDTVDKMIHKTHVVCNPRGYYPDYMNINYNPIAIVEVKN